jgi:hypothetical protein
VGENDEAKQHIAACPCFYTKATAALGIVDKAKSGLAAWLWKHAGPCWATAAEFSSNTCVLLLLFQTRPDSPFAKGCCVSTVS